mgnify:CR=1 FL=1
MLPDLVAPPPDQVVQGTGFANLSWLNIIMLIIGGVFIYLGIARKYEPLLLVPIGFGAILDGSLAVLRGLASIHNRRLVSMPPRWY